MTLSKNTVGFFVPTKQKNIYTLFNKNLEQQFSFLFAFVRGETFPTELTIKAINNGKEEYINLIYMPKHFYRAEVET